MTGPFITQLEATDSLKFAITHDRPLLSHKLIVRNTCKVAMVFSEFQKGMTINIMHRTKHMVDNTTMEQLKIPQVQNIITKEHISEYTRKPRQVHNSRLQPYNKRVCKIAYLYL